MYNFKKGKKALQKYKCLVIVSNEYRHPAGYRRAPSHTSKWAKRSAWIQRNRMLLDEIHMLWSWEPVVGDMHELKIVRELRRRHHIVWITQTYRWIEYFQLECSRFWYCYNLCFHKKSVRRSLGSSDTSEFIIWDSLLKRHQVDLSVYGPDRPCFVAKEEKNDIHSL